MLDYSRYRVPGGTYFFTVNLLERYGNDLLVRHIDPLRSIVRETRKRWPFHIDAWVVLPEHLHCVWTLPIGDDDNANRWRVIKQGFSKALACLSHSGLCSGFKCLPMHKPGVFTDFCQAPIQGLSTPF